MAEQAVNWLNLAPLCLALSRYGNGDRLSEIVLHFGSALPARGVWTDVELGKFLSTSSAVSSPTTSGGLTWSDNFGKGDGVMAGVTQLEQIPSAAKCGAEYVGVVDK